MAYIFMSFSTYGKKNIGCCIVQVKKSKDANSKCDELGLTPSKPNDARAFILPDQKAFEAQEMDLDRFYTKKEMLQKGFETDND